MSYTLADALREYSSAKRALVCSSPGTRVHDTARHVLDELGSTQWDYPVECLLCKQSFEMTVDIAEISTWHGAPRGICRTCSHRTEQEIIVTETGTTHIRGDK